MWRLGLGSGETYPERVGVSDCVYYMRTGFCGFGSRCRYNHPRDRAAVAAAVRFVGGEYPERPGEPPCQFYLKTGTCKYGATCKFDHPRTTGASLSNVSLNYRGYPLRPGEKECSFYMHTGECRFGITCKFHHPQPAGMSMPMPTNAPPFYPTVQSPSSVPLAEPMAGASTSYRVARPPILPGSYVSGAYGPMLLSPGVVPVPGWTSYSGPVSPAMSPGAPGAQPSGAGGSVYAVSPLSSTNPTLGPGSPYPPVQSSPAQLSIVKKEVNFPERPGQPECQYYIRTGDCKFGSSCKFHHPLERAGSSTPCYLNPLGLPLRPGAQSCTFYLQNGYCKFGHTCKFDHPLEAMKSLPTSTDMATIPYIAGSPVQGLPRSFSSPEFSPDHGSAMKREAHIIRMSSSGGGGGGSTTSMGFSFSSQTTPPVSLSTGVQQ